MNIRKVMTSFALATLLMTDVGSFVPVFANEATAKQSITAVEGQSVKASYQTRYENDELVMTFVPDTVFFAKEPIAELKLWAKSWPIEEAFSFKETSPGLYEVRVPQNQLTMEELEIHLKTESGQSYHFDKLTYPKQDTGASANTVTSQTVLGGSTTTQVEQPVTTGSLSTTSTVTTSKLPATSQEPTQPTITKEEAKGPNLSIVPQGNQGNFDVVVTNVPMNQSIHRLRLPIWSDEKGQDDLVWYTAIKQADGSYKVSVDLAKHKYTAGKYHVHLYYELTNKQIRGVMATTTQVTLPKLEVQSLVTKVSNASYLIKVTNVPQYVTSLKIPVWSENKGQDDLVWYQATKKSDGSYELLVNLSKHRFDTGKYNAHLYGTIAPQNKMVGIGQVKDFQVEPLPAPAGKVRIGNIDSANMRFDVIVSDVVAPGGLKSIKVPVWSADGGQDDLQWYTASLQTDGTYKVTVSVASHKYTFGQYHAHVYAVLENGKMVGLATTQAQITKPANVTSFHTSYNGMGNYYLSIQPVYTSGPVRFAVWSDQGGQDDLRWYEAYRQQAFAYAGNFNVQHHKGTGKYHIHIYQVVNGQMRGLGATSITVARSSYQAPYYSQRDSRWGGIHFGAWSFAATGCVPTSMAMVISGIRGITVTPVQVGNFLHYHTLEYNRNFYGTSSRGLVMAARNWGLKTSALNSYQALETALRQDYYVTAAVGPSKYIAVGGHEIVLKGYRNGQTYVLDPYNAANNGWTSLSYLWQIASTDPIDRTEGLPFIRISD
ncbi:GBS Bsp-like repeat-containing protein [Streptococcus ovis]|uniref:GBS Bsp-like repeat-containing protein n=1 Tax=Streptococcus ovis TaxID=82806 RepID=UPI0003755CEB|nr:GBS Bsp-like repeat-containing protein [Streptococcus ovis]